MLDPTHQNIVILDLKVQHCVGKTSFRVGDN